MSRAAATRARAAAVRGHVSSSVAAHPEAGFSAALAVGAILILITLGLALVSIVVEDSDLAVNHVQSNQAFYAANAGIEYAVMKLAASSAWGGLPMPGKAVGAGVFWIAPPDNVDENGNPLPVGRQRVVATGIVGGATRSIQVHVAAGTMTTYAGNGGAGYTGDGGPATSAQLRRPEGVAVSAVGDLYVADTDNHVVRRVDAVTGVISTVAGNGSPGYTGDGGAATAARLHSPEDVFVAPNGDLYIADTANHVIRRVSATTGAITTVAGNGSPGSIGDGGAATAARLNSPRGIVVAANGDYFVGDRSNHKIRKVTAATGVITTYAGTGSQGYTGDGGAATAARLRTPQGIHLSPAGVLYISDAGNHVVRQVSAGGIITTIAGTGTAGYTGNGGVATAARLDGPEAIHEGPGGDLYVTDTGNHVVRRIQAGTQIISTIAGTGAAGFSGDGGAATAATMDRPRGIAITSGGVFYIGDRNNNRVRKVTGVLSVVAWVETRT